MFPSIEIEGYMEPKLSGILRVNLVVKSIALVSTGTHFMHMMVKTENAVINEFCLEIETIYKQRN